MRLISLALRLDGIFDLIRELLGAGAYIHTPTSPFIFFPKPPPQNPQRKNIRNFFYHIFLIPFSTKSFSSSQQPDFSLCSIRDDVSILFTSSAHHIRPGFTISQSLCNFPICSNNKGTFVTDCVSARF
jgi:hypothetical protein